MTVQQIADAAAAARARAHHTLGQTAGFCGLASRLLGYELVGAGCQVDLVIGSFDGAHHVWLTVDGVTVDPTADQFDPGASVLPAEQSRYRTLLRLPLDAADAHAWIAAELARVSAPGARAYGSRAADAAAARLLRSADQVTALAAADGAPLVAVGAKRVTARPARQAR